jgi:hypothetical protein
MFSLTCDESVWGGCKPRSWDYSAISGRKAASESSVSGMTRPYHAALAFNAAQALRKTNRTAARTTHMQKTPRLAITKP